MDDKVIRCNQSLARRCIGHAVDIVFCIDGTESQKETLDLVRRMIPRFFEDLYHSYHVTGRWIVQLRCKIILFRDYQADGQYAMQTTDFFLLPQQENEFIKCINGIQARGGGDPQEDGLEALAYAIKSSWTVSSTKKRHIIIVLSDADTHPLGYNKDFPNYPKGMSANLSDLEEWWEDEMDIRAKRLVLLTPNVGHWACVGENWSQTWLVPQEDLDERIYHELVRMLTNAM